jgi:hypothetical protein
MPIYAPNFSALDAGNYLALAHKGELAFGDGDYYSRQ